MIEVNPIMKSLNLSIFLFPQEDVFKPTGSQDPPTTTVVLKPKLRQFLFKVVVGLFPQLFVPQELDCFLHGLGVDDLCEEVLLLPPLLAGPVLPAGDVLLVVVVERHQPGVDWPGPELAGLEGTKERPGRAVSGPGGPGATAGLQTEAGRQVVLVLAGQPTEE